MILFCTSVGSHEPVILHDALVGLALRDRGMQVEILLCDGMLPACEACFCTRVSPAILVKNGPQGSLCRKCFQAGLTQFDSLGFRVHRYSTFLQDKDRKEAENLISGIGEPELRGLTIDGIRIGEEAYAGALRYFAVGDLDGEPVAQSVLRRYVLAAYLTMCSIERALSAIRPSIVIFHHGIYVPQGIVGQIARRQHIRVVNWALGYRKKTFIYSHGDTYHRTMISEPRSQWDNGSLSEKDDQRLTEYLKSRQTNSQDWFKFNQEPESSLEEIRKRLALDSRPIVLLLTNVTWDAQLYYSTSAFPSLLDWLEYSILHFAKRPDLQLVVRVHPAEVRGTLKSRQPVMEVMQRRIPVLPPNVKVVGASSDISTYGLAELSVCTFIFGTKTGVELSAIGKTVIVVGDAWIRTKGFSIDISNMEQYEHVLRALPNVKRLTEEQIQWARQYAYHYFFRRYIPINILSYDEPRRNVFHSFASRSLRKIFPSQFVVNSPFRVDFTSLTSDKLRSDGGLQRICDAILNNQPFVYDEALGRITH